MSESTPAFCCLQRHLIPVKLLPAPGGKRRWYRIYISGGHGGDAITDIHHDLCSAVIPAWAILAAIYNEYDFDVALLRVGESDTQIATSAEIVICIPSGEAAEFAKAQQEMMNEWLREEYGQNDPDVSCSITKCERQDLIINKEAFEALMSCLEQTPQGPIQPSEKEKSPTNASNNVGRIETTPNGILVTTCTSSHNSTDLAVISQDIAQVFSSFGASTESIR